MAMQKDEGISWKTREIYYSKTSAFDDTGVLISP
jgi:hypothetical protein